MIIKERKVKLLIIVSLVLFFVFLSSSFLFAKERKLEIEYPEIFGLKPGNLQEYIRYIFVVAIVIAGFILLGGLIYNGISYLLSVGQPAKLKEAKERMTSLFLGVALLLAGYLILYTINPQLVSLQPLIFLPWEEKPITPVTPLEPEKTSLISLELPLAPAIKNKNGLWEEEKRNEIKKLTAENKDFLNQEIKLGSPTFNRISDLNKYLLGLTEECRCENLKALSTFPTNFGMPADPKACVGDPCLEKARKEIEKISAINRGKQKELLDFEKKIIEIRKDFEKRLRMFTEVEEQIHSCEREDKSLISLTEYLTRLNFFNKYGWKSEIVTIPDAPPGGGDPATFYCAKGGTLFKYPSALELEEEEIAELLPLESAKLIRPELFREKFKYQKISCPVEFPIGEITDMVRTLASLLIVKLDELAELHSQMASKIEKMGELISQCNAKNCNNNTLCVDNPCFEPACGIPPARVNKCGIGKCTPPTPVTPNPCYPFCDSPCLQAVGGCYGICSRGEIEELARKIEECKRINCPVEEMRGLYQEVSECNDACPRNDLATTVAEIKGIEDRIFETIKEIEEILPQVSSLIYDEENPRNLENIKTGIGLCYSSNPEEPSWMLLSCDQALGNFGPTGQIIGACHPRNFFCCLPPEKELVFPWTPPPITPLEELSYILPVPKYEPLPAITVGDEKGCPNGWRCTDDVKKYNQYQDASQPLKELLACMRERLDNIQKEGEIKGPSIGRITSISDSVLYRGQCKWETGPSQPPCSHTYNIKYDNIAVSCHYGGVYKRYDKKSYAVDFGARLPGDHYKLVELAAKECRPGVFTLVHGSDENLHLHVSLGQLYQAGCDPSPK